MILNIECMVENLPIFREIKTTCSNLQNLEVRIRYVRTEKLDELSRNLASDEFFTNLNQMEIKWGHLDKDVEADSLENESEGEDIMIPGLTQIHSPAKKESHHSHTMTFNL